MANIGSLVVDLQANSAAFVAEMQKARVAVERTATAAQTALSGMSRAFQSVQRFATGFLSAFSAQAIIGFAAHVVETVGGLGELAEQLGLSTDALQAYQYAATQSGLSSEQFQAAMIRLNDTIGNATRGTKDAIESFQRLGVRILDGSRQLRTTEDILDDIAEGLMKIEEPARRAAAANDLFGRAGARLLPLLSSGASGLARFREEARAAGVVIDPATIARADALADSWAALRLEIEAIATGPAVAAFEAIAAALRVMRQAANIPFDLGARARRATDRAFMTPDQIAAADDAERIARENEVQSGLWRDLDRRPGVSNPAVVDRSAAAADARKNANAVSDLQDQLLRANREYAGFNREAAIGESLSRLSATATARQVEIVTELAGSLFDVKEATRRLEQEEQDGTRIWEQTRTASENLQDSLRNLNYLHEVGAIDAETFGRAVADAYLKGTELGRAVDDLGSAFSDAFEAAIVKGESLRDVLGSLLADIGRLLVRIAILEPLKQAITSGIGALFSPSGGGSGGGASHSAMGNILTSRGPLTLAGGGVVSSPHLALIGEGAMNEAVVPLPDGRRIPVALSGGGRGGHTFVTNIDARDASPGMLPRIQAMIDQGNAKTLAAVATMARDGGGFARQTGARRR